MGLFRELQRRNVIRVGLAYLAGSWLLVQVLDIVGEAWDAPDLFMRLVITALVAGLPVALLLAWAYELTPEGLRREQPEAESGPRHRHVGRRLDRVIMLLLALAVGYFVVERFWPVTPSPEGAESSLESVESAESPSASGRGNGPDPGLPADRSLAVLPLGMVGSQQLSSLVATGVHSGLVTELSQISSLRLVSRASAERVADRELSSRQMASLLNVANLLFGEIQVSGDQLRISLQLVDAATDAYLWAETFDRELTADNVFQIQDEVARAVATALEATLTAGESERLGRTPTQNLEALERVYRATALLEQRGGASIEAARELFHEARELDPNFARAFAGEAQAILLSVLGYSFGTIPREEALALATPLVERALELDPEDDMALAAMGRVRSLEFRNAEAVDWFRRSLAVNPSNASVINWLHNELMYTGNYSESTRLAVKGAQVDPMSRIALHVAAVAMARELDGEERDITVMIERLDQIDPAWAQMTRGDIARERGALVDAVRHYQQALRRDPDLYRAREVLAAQLLAWDLAAEAGAVDSNFDEFYIAYHSGNWPRALALAQARFEASPQDIDSVVNLALTLRSAGRWEEALQLGLIVWEAIGRNPHRWPPDELISVAWGGALTERPAVREQFVIATRTVLDSVESAGQRGIWYHFDLAEAMLAALEGRYGEGVRHLAAAVDRGFRDLREAEGVMLAPLAGDLGYREQLDRMQRLIAEERSQVLDLVCGDGGLLAQQRNLADVCLRP